MTNEIKPCPFCGSNNIKLSENMFTGFTVICYGCGLDAGFYGHHEKSKTIEAWNKRQVDHVKPLD